MIKNPPYMNVKYSKLHVLHTVVLVEKSDQTVCGCYLLSMHIKWKSKTMDSTVGRWAGMHMHKQAGSSQIMNDR